MSSLRDVMCLKRFQPAHEEVSGIDVSHVCDGTAKWQSAALLGGKIYAVPYHAKLGGTGRWILCVDVTPQATEKVDDSVV